MDKSNSSITNIQTNGFICAPACFKFSSFADEQTNQIVFIIEHVWTKFKKEGKKAENVIKYEWMSK